MIIYLIQYLLLFIIAIFLKDIVQIKKFQAFLLWLILFIPMGLRNVSVGTDTVLYSNIFIRNGTSPLSNLEGNMTPSYFLYNKMIYLIFPDYHFFLLVNAMIIMGMIILGCYYLNLRSFPFYIIVFYSLYYYFNSYNISRQMLAWAIMFLGVAYFLKNKKILVSLVLFLLSISIHNTSIFICLFFFVSQSIKWNRIKLLLLAVFTLFVCLLKNKVLSFFITVFTHYSFYETNTDVRTIGEGNKLFLALFYLFIVILSVVLMSDVDNEKKLKFNIIQSFCVIGVVIGLLFSKDILLGRIEQYFSIFQMILIIDTTELFIRRVTLDKKIFKPLMFLLLFIILSVPLIYQLNKNYGDVLPYTTWLR